MKGDPLPELRAALARTFAYRGDTTRARAYADSARAAGEVYLREAP